MSVRGRVRWIRRRVARALDPELSKCRHEVDVRVLDDEGNVIAAGPAFVSARPGRPVFEGTVTLAARRYGRAVSAEARWGSRGRYGSLGGFSPVVLTAGDYLSIGVTFTVEAPVAT